VSAGLQLREHPQAVSVVQLPPGAPAPEWATGGPLASVTWTAEETSVVCPSSAVPDELPGRIEGPFTAFEVAGPLGFSLTGVLATLLRPLADARISVFTVSTYDTDWLLVRAGSAAEARSAWRADGHDIGAVA
jgi:hypothetical protein